MDTVSAGNFVRDQVPLRYQSLLATTLRTAYAAADALAQEQPILQVCSAVDNRGRLRQWAVDLALERSIKTGQWPVDYRWAPFAQPTGRYIEVRLSHSTLSVSQVADAAKQPRNVVFRRNSRLTNEPFLDLPEFDDERQVRGMPGLLLVHGHQELNFAHVAVPHALHHRDYIYRTPNLMEMAHAIPSAPPDAPPPEDTDFEAQMTLKAEIEKWQREHGG